MANLRSLLSLRTDAYRLSDLENSTVRFPASEVNEYVNKGIRHVYAEMISISDKPFFVKQSDITCNPPPFGMVAAYPLPNDFLRMLSVGWANTVGGTSGGPWIPLEPYQEADRVQLMNANYYAGVGPLKYGVTGGPTAFTQGTQQCAYSIEILPNPTNGSMLRIRYIPTPPDLINDTDTFDGILGFEDAVTTWAAILMRRKDEMDSTDLERDMQKHMSRIHLIAKRRDGSRPPKVSIVRGRGAATYGGKRGNGWGVW